MRLYIKTAASFLTAAVLFSCGGHDQPKTNTIENTDEIKAPSNNIEVRLTGIIRTRRSYANIQFIKSEKEKDRYLEKQRRSDPEVFDLEPHHSDSFLYRAFEKQHLVEGISFRIGKFKKQTSDTASFSDANGRLIKMHFYNEAGYGWVKFFHGKDSLAVNTGATSLQDLEYAFMDIIPGGNKELVYLDDYYIMNGDNFDFMVYEINLR